MYELQGSDGRICVDLATRLQADRTLLIVGWQKERSSSTFKIKPQVEFIEQTEHWAPGMPFSRRGRRSRFDATCGPFGRRAALSEETARASSAITGLGGRRDDSYRRTRRAVG